MIASTTLQMYIDRLDEVITSGDVAKAKELQDEILATLSSDLDGLKRGLENYKPHVLYSSSNGHLSPQFTVDFIKDAKTLRSRLQVELEKIEPEGAEQTMRDMLFISHRSIDKEVADMLKDFLVITGIPNDKIFCSSLPGNDINFRISAEVKKQLQESIVNILILSKDYYESAYCLNEAGIAWYLENEVDNIAICLPEINEDNMWGFFNGENKVRRLNNENDVAAIYDLISTRLNIQSAGFAVMTRERQKLTKRYEEFLEGRNYEKSTKADIRESLEKHGVENVINCEYSPINLLASVELFFAAEGGGKIMVVSTLSDTSYIAGKTMLNTTNSPRELAKWEAGTFELLRAGYIEQIGIKDRIYQVTERGYNISDAFKCDNQIDASMSPGQILRMFNDDKDD